MSDGQSLTVVEHRKALLDIFECALAAVNGRRVVRDALEAEILAGPVHLVAIGKAAVAMAQGAADALGVRIVDGLVITKHGYGEPLAWPVIEAGHPLPDRHSLQAGQALLDYVARLPDREPVLVLLSGGASSLVEAPVAGVDLAQLIEVNQRLLAGGLPINVCNRVRKAMSTLKGGRLAARLVPRPVLCLAISDVPDNDPAVIGSGPLSPDPAVAVPLPAGFDDLPRQQLPDSTVFDSIRYRIVADSATAAGAAAGAARDRGYQVMEHPDLLCGDAIEQGRAVASTAKRAVVNQIHVWHGETTVVLPSRPGRGGRNQSLALAAAVELTGRRDCLVLAAGTDGSDGPTGDAGALVDGATVERGAQAGLDARTCLREADAGRFLEASGDLLTTGPTGTNVMDLVIGLRWR